MWNLANCSIWPALRDRSLEEDREMSQELHAPGVLHVRGLPDIRVQIDPYLIR